MNLNLIPQPYDVNKHRPEIVAIIDSDSLVYQCAHPGKDEWGDTLPDYTEEEYEKAEMKLGERVLGILNKIEEDYTIVKHFLCIKGKKNFRYAVYEEYKANRPKPLPIINHLCKYLVDNFQAIEAHGYEADDLVYTLALDLKSKALICSIDKDLKQIPGLHYNYNKEEYSEGSEEEAVYNLGIQMIMGDNGDNLNPLRGVGIKTAQKLISFGMSEKDIMRVCLTMYKMTKYWGDEAKEKIRMYYKLLKLQNINDRRE